MLSVSDKLKSNAVWILSHLSSSYVQSATYVISKDPQSSWYDLETHILVSLNIEKIGCIQLEVWQLVTECNVSYNTKSCTKFWKFTSEIKIVKKTQCQHWLMGTHHVQCT